MQKGNEPIMILRVNMPESSPGRFYWQMAVGGEKCGTVEGVSLVTASVIIGGESGMICVVVGIEDVVGIRARACCTADCTACVAKD